MTKVILEIDFCESDEILLGELDHYLTTRFKVKSIKVGEDENIFYDNKKEKEICVICRKPSENTRFEKFSDGPMGDVEGEACYKCIKDIKGFDI